MLEFDIMRGEGKNYTESINMKTLMKTAMKTIVKSSLCAIVAVVLSTTTALAANFVATQSGYWDAETTWKSGAVPSSSDSVTGAENGPVVTVRDAREIAGIEISNASFELAVDGSDASLAVSGHYKANFGNYNGGRIVVRNGGTLSLNTLELVNNGGTTSGSYIYVTNGATLTASGLLKTTSSKDVFVVKNAEKVNLSANFELANESVRSGCQPDHELWWDGYGEFSVGGVMKVMGDGALRSGRASGSKSRVFFSGHPAFTVGGDFWMLETNRVDETETKLHTSELHFSAITPGKGGRPIVSVGGKAYLDGAVSIGKGDWIGVIGTDGTSNPIKILSATDYDDNYAQFDRLELHKNFSEGMLTLSKNGSDVVLAPNLDAGTYTEKLVAGTKTKVYTRSDASSSFLFRVQRQDSNDDDIELYFNFIDSAYSGCDFISKTAATKNLSVVKLEANEDGWTHKVTLHRMKGTKEFAIALDFSSFKFGGQPQNIGYLQQAMFGKKGSNSGTIIIIR